MPLPHVIRAVMCGLVAAISVVLGASPALAAAQNAPTSGPVVLVGAPGLRWEDLDPEATPTLWRLAGRSALGNLTVRSVSRFTCPVDGWLVVSSGRRSEAPRPDNNADTSGDDNAPVCAAIPEPTADPTAAGDQTRVPGWADYQKYNDDKPYDAELGTLGDSLAAAGTRATAIGPGAAVALATSQGRVSRYLPAGTVPTEDQWRATALTVLALDGIAEAGFVARTADDRKAQVRQLDRQLQTQLRNLPADATVLLAGVADSSPKPHLAVAAATGEEYPDGWLTASSTRRDGLVQLTDIAPTLLDLLDIEKPDTFIGARWTSTGSRPDTATAVDQLTDKDTAAQVMAGLVPPFFLVLVISQVLLYGVAAVALRREWGGPDIRMRVLRATRRAALVFAAVPISTFLANLVPWWRASTPALALFGALLAGVLAVTLVAQLGPWRHRMLGPFGAVAATTALVLGLDVATGARLQEASLMGYTPLVAGRFYGFGNIAFALFATGAVLGAAGFAEPLVRNGRRTAAVALVAVIGAVCVVLDGTPRWGSDFGGVIALVPAFAVLGIGVAGARVTVRRFALAVAGGVAAIAVIATLDWLRPAEQRSHLGRFVQQVLDGEAVDVVTRKLGANVSTFQNYRLSILLPVAFAFMVLVLMRPRDWRAAALSRAYDRAPTLRPGVTATLVALVMGFAVNDSGVAIPAVGLTLAVPLILAASVTALERDELERPVGGPPGAAPTPRAPQPEPGAAKA